MDWLTVGTGLLRVVTLGAGLGLGGGAGAAWLARGLGAPAQPTTHAARRLARPLLGLLLAAAPLLAVAETLWESNAQRDLTLLPGLVPYVLTNTLFGIVWAAHVLVLGGL